MAVNLNHSHLPVIQEYIREYIDAKTTAGYKEESFIDVIVKSMQDNERAEGSSESSSFAASLYAGEPGEKDFISTAYKMRILELLIP